MAIDVSLNDLANLDNGPTATATINANNAAIESALLNALSTQGTSPNQMNAQLDMNSFNIINLPTPATINSPVRLADVSSNPTITIPPTGTSGGTVPFLNGANTWSGSDDFTGATLTAATQTATDNSTKVATTSYVQANLANSITGPSVAAVNTATTRVPTALTGTASQFLSMDSGGTTLSFKTLTGDAALSGPTLTLATVNANTGGMGSSTAIPTITTNAKGLVTAVSTNSVVAPAGTLSGSTLASGVINTSIASTGPNVELGVDLASPTTSSLTAPGTLTGTNNQAATDFTIAGSRGTGTGVGGSIIFSTAPAGSSGTTQNPLVEAQRILPSGIQKFTNAANFTANGSVATTVTSLGPAGSHTTIQKWLTIQDNTGTVVYIPCY